VVRDCPAGTSLSSSTHHFITCGVAACMSGFSGFALSFGRVFSYLGSEERFFTNLITASLYGMGS
jgi:hypothetical protein